MLCNTIIYVYKEKGSLEVERYILMSWTTLYTGWGCKHIHVRVLMCVHLKQGELQCRSVYEPTCSRLHTCVLPVHVKFWGTGKWWEYHRKIWKVTGNYSFLFILNQSIFPDRNSERKKPQYMYRYTCILVTLKDIRVSWNF